MSSAISSRVAGTSRTRRARTNESLSARRDVLGLAPPPPSPSRRRPRSGRPGPGGRGSRAGGARTACGDAAAAPGRGRPGPVDAAPSAVPASFRAPRVWRYWYFIGPSTTPPRGVASPEPAPPAGHAIRAVRRTRGRGAGCGDPLQLPESGARLAIRPGLCLGSTMPRRWSLLSTSQHRAAQTSPAHHPPARRSDNGPP